MNLTELDGKNKQELLDLAKELGLENGLSALSKGEIVFRMMQSHAEQQGYILASGILDLVNDGYGFLRQPNLKHSPNDVYVSQSQIRRFALRTGALAWTFTCRPGRSSVRLSSRPRSTSSRLSSTT